jgi:hypothetical protein
VISNPELFNESIENEDAMQEMAADIRKGLQQLHGMGFNVGIQENEDSLPSIDEESMQQETGSEVASIIEADDSGRAEQDSQDNEVDDTKTDAVHNSRAYAAYDVLRSGLIAEDMDVSKLLPQFRELLAMSTYESQHYSLLETDIESDDSDADRNTKGLKQSEVYSQRLAIANWLYDGVKMCEEEKEEGTHRLKLFSNFLVSGEAEQ